MKIFSQVETFGHEQVVYCYDRNSNLKAIIAIHDTTLGPALGGTRLLPYEDENEALKDVLRLSRGMTYKAACAGLALGGGKAVIIADPSQKSEAMFRAYGRFINSLNGRYITAEDMNTNVANMDHIRMETRFVTGVSMGLGGSGDPSSMTARGVLLGIQTAVQYRLAKHDLRGVTIAVQGIGSVGWHLVKSLNELGATLYITDIDEKKLKTASELFNAKVVSETELYSLDVDVFAPCARGAVINDNSLKQLKAKVIAGCANNQLELEEKHAVALKEMKILYAPDYVINAGGLINVANELIGYNVEKVSLEVARISQTLESIFAQAEKLDLSTQEAAKRFAEKRIESVANLKTMTSFDHSAIGNIIHKV